MTLPKLITGAASAVAFVLAVSVSTLATTGAVEAGAIDDGKKIAFDRKKGNCLACHAIEGGSLPGNIGPPLVSMKDRYPNKDKLKQQIFDATKNNPNSIMPPFGKHSILTASELDSVVEFIHSL